jgi:hypothetical protein
MVYIWSLPCLVLKEIEFQLPPRKSIFFYFWVTILAMNQPSCLLLWFLNWLNLKKYKITFLSTFCLKFSVNDVCKNIEVYRVQCSNLKLKESLAMKSVLHWKRHIHIRTFWAFSELFPNVNSFSGDFDRR